MARKKRPPVNTDKRIRQFLGHPGSKDNEDDASLCIDSMCAKIRAGWTESERRQRETGPRPENPIPVVGLEDFGLTEAGGDRIVIDTI